MFASKVQRGFSMSTSSCALERVPWMLRVSVDNEYDLKQIVGTTGFVNLFFYHVCPFWLVSHIELNDNMQD